LNLTRESSLACDYILWFPLIPSFSCENFIFICKLSIYPLHAVLVLIFGCERDLPDFKILNSRRLLPWAPSKYIFAINFWNVINWFFCHGTQVVRLIKLAKNNKITVSVSWAIIWMASNSTIWILYRDKQIVIQVKDKGISVIQKMISFFLFLNTSPFCGSKSANTWAVLELNEADGRSYIIAFFMEILGTPTILSSIENHFDRNQFLAQIIYYFLYLGVFFSYKRRCFKVILGVNRL